MARVMGNLRPCLYHRRAPGTTLDKKRPVVGRLRVGLCKIAVVAVKSCDLQDEVEDATLFFGRCVITRKKVRDELD